MESDSISMTLAEVATVHDKLDRVIFELEALTALDRSVSNASPEIDSVMILGRRIGPTTVSPTFVRFSSDVGPLEPLPQRFRVPFPTIDDFRLSVVNHSIHLPSATMLKSATQQTVIHARDEYADDF
jgi:hypothetical protein